MRWWLALSFRRYSFDRWPGARRHVQTAKEKRRAGGRVLHVVMHAAAAVLFAPKVALYVGCLSGVRARAPPGYGDGPRPGRTVGQLSPTTARYLEQTEAWSDGWVGPRLAVTREIERQARVVRVAGSADLQHVTKPLILTVRLNGRAIGRHRVHQPGDFSCGFLSRILFHLGLHTVDVEASTWFVPDDQTGNGDLRPLAWRLPGQAELDGVTTRRFWCHRSRARGSRRTDEAQVDQGARDDDSLLLLRAWGSPSRASDQGRFLGEALD